MSTRLVIGCMTGTSLDGLDAALVEISGSGLGLSAKLVALRDAPLGEAGTVLRLLASGQPVAAADICGAARQFGELHAEVCVDLAGDRGVDSVAVHGQTVYHAAPSSWQLINPWPIVSRVGCRVVSDLRGADLAAAGQGAPITPLADFVMFGHAEVPRVIVNLGGFCNATFLPAGDDPAGVRGFDVCVCNQLLDEAARRVLGTPFDRDGDHAAAGHADPAAADQLFEALVAQHAAGRSLGTGDEGLAWLDAHADRLAANDLLASAASGVGRAIAHACAGGELLLAGGGARNRALVRAIGSSRTTGDLGVPVEAREAMAMAVLGALADDGVPITLQAVTGREDRVPLAGSWTYPAKA